MGPGSAGQLVTVFYGQDKYLCYIRTHSFEPKPTLWPGLGSLEGCVSASYREMYFPDSFTRKHFGPED